MPPAADAAVVAAAAEPTLHRREGRSMASPLRLSLADGGPVRPAAVERTADRWWQAVRAEFEAADLAMSRFRDDAELTSLNRASPGPQPASRRLAAALLAADRAHRVTAGRFEPRVVGALERIGYFGVPQGSSVDKAPATRVVLRQGRSRQLAVPVPVDLGGIGKGLALRWSRRALERLGPSPGVAGWLLEAGGDVVTAGRPTPGGSWRVGIEDPGGGSEPVAVVDLDGGWAIATSSVRRLAWEHAGVRVHHLIDPATGAPAGTGLLAVTVAGPDPAWAEVWSKALFVEGHAGIAALARARGLAAWWVTDDGDLEMTPAARLRTTWVRSEG